MSVDDVLKNLSVIIPLGPGEDLWKDLLNDLTYLPVGSEIHLVSSEPLAEREIQQLQKKLAARLYAHHCNESRPKKLNLGASKAQNDFLWFLHADTKVPRYSMVELAHSLKSKPKAIHFFDIRFLDDGPQVVKITALTFRFRARVLELPVGQNGLSFHRDVFERVGRFPKQVKYGEDELFIWRAHELNVPFKAVPAPLYTSARRYQNNGWAFTTLRQFLLSVKQGAPAVVSLARRRWVPKVKDELLEKVTGKVPGTDL